MTDKSTQSHSLCHFKIETEVYRPEVHDDDPDGLLRGHHPGLRPRPRRGGRGPCRPHRGRRPLRRRPPAEVARLQECPQRDRVSG